MVNPFEDQDAPFLALVNVSAEVSLWPAFLPAPEGWRVVAGPAPRAEILAFIEASGETPERHAA
jgi:MbtH protein